MIRRVTALLAKAGLIATRPGASGGSWLLRQPRGHPARRGAARRQRLRASGLAAARGAKGCPVSEHIPRQVAKALTAADSAAHDALSNVTIADLLAENPASLAAFTPHASCPVPAEPLDETAEPVAA